MPSSTQSETPELLTGPLGEGDETGGVGTSTVTGERAPSGAAARRGVQLARPAARAVRDRVAGWWRPAVVYLASRLVILFAVRLATAVHPGLSWRAALDAWDSSIWTGLAQHGYPSSPVPAVGSTLAFFPLYPVSIRGVDAVTGLGLFASGVLIATVCGLVATVLLWAFSASLWDRRRADLAAALFCFSPGALAFSMAYSEGLLLVLAVPALWAAMRRRWLLAGVLAGLATAVRPNAIGLIAILALMSAHAIWKRRDWRSLLAAALSPAGLVAFVVYLKIHTGSWTAWPRAQSEGWFEKSNFKGLYLAAHSFWAGQFNPTATLVLVGAFLIVAGFALCWQSGTPWQLVAYSFFAVLPALASQQVSTKPRMVLVAFPLFMAAGARLRGIGAQVALAVMVALTVAFSAYILAVPLTAP